MTVGQLKILLSLVEDECDIWLATGGGSLCSVSRAIKITNDGKDAIIFRPNERNNFD